MKKDDIDTLIEQTRNSSFNKTNYAVTVRLRGFFDSMLLHTHYDLIKEDQEQVNCFDVKDGKPIITYDEWLQDITPEFQRDNNKWTPSMKQKFIENLLSGAKTELLFFNLNENEDSKILDGLQRTTAIVDFFNDKVKPFGYSFNELKEKLNHFRTDITIRIYTFNNIAEVGKFYIDMNENITHSQEDILKAKNYFLNNLDIFL